MPTLALSRRIPPKSGRIKTAPEGGGTPSRGLTRSLDSTKEGLMPQRTRTLELASNERWRPVVGYEGLYEVSSFGRVKSLARIDSLGRLREGRALTPTGLRHLHVTLSKDGAKVQPTVHRLVLEAFVGPCPEGMEACHWDDDPTNNRLSNLRWDTHSENFRDAVRNGRRNKAFSTYCMRGHALTRENTYVHEGKRNCRECQRERERAYRARKIKEMSNAE